MLQATVKSSLVECKYHFLVGTEFDSILCCSGKPTIDIPIIMYIPDIRPNVQLYQPNNWNPKAMPFCEIRLPTFDEIIINNNNVGFNSAGNNNFNNQNDMNNQGMMTNQTKATNVNNQGGMANQTQQMYIDQGGMSKQTQAVDNNQGGMTFQTHANNNDLRNNQGEMTSQTQPMNYNQDNDKKNNY